MTEVTPHPLKTQGFHHFLILLFYDHPPLQRVFCFLASQHRQYAVVSSWNGMDLVCGFNV